MQRVLKIIAILIAIALLVYLLWELQLILLYLLISVVLSFLGRPIMKILGKIKLSEKKLPNTISAMVTLFVMIGLFAGLLSMFIPLIVSEYELIRSVDISEASANLAEPLENVRNFLARYGLDKIVQLENLAMLQSNLMELLSVADVPSFVGKVFGTLTNLLIAVFSVLFITFFFLKDARLFEESVLVMSPDKFIPQVTNILDHSKKLLTRYFVGLIIQMAIITISATIGLTILGVKNALLIGFFAGAINIIPYLGPLLGGIFGIIVAVTTNVDLDFYHELMPLLLKIALVFIIIQLMDNFIIQPFVLGSSVSAHPLEIFLVVLSAGTLGGVLGMIIAIPTYTIIRVIAKEFLQEFKIVKKLTKDI